MVYNETMNRRKVNWAMFAAVAYLITILFLFLNSRLCGVFWCGILLNYLTLPWIWLAQRFVLGIESRESAEMIAYAASALLNAGVIYSLIRSFSTASARN